MADYTIDAADPRWKRFEKLVARIVATLSSDAVVTYDDKIPGRLSGVLRQIDVSIRAAKAEINIPFAIKRYPERINAVT